MYIGFVVILFIANRSIATNLRIPRRGAIFINYRIILFRILFKDDKFPFNLDNDVYRNAPGEKGLRTLWVRDKPRQLNHRLQISTIIPSLNKQTFCT